MTAPPTNGVAHAPIGGVGVTGSLYEHVLATSKAEGVCFDFADCAGRVLRTLIAYYWLLIRFPISFSIFLVRYNMLWEGPVVGLLLTAFSLPFYPLAAMGLLLAKKLCGAGAYNPGNIFFTPPDDPLTSLLWDYYKVMSPPLSQFMLNRGDTVAVAHSWYDHITDKFFWRRHLEAVGARVPRQLGVWKELEGGKWGVEWSHPLKGEDIVIKIADESNGIGDAFLRNGSGEGMMGSEADVHAFLSAPFYTGRETLVLEWIRPAAGQEVHSLDVVTVATPDGGIELLTVLYWGDCADGKTTHSTRAGYMVDVEQEKICATARWYAPGFGKMVPKPTYSLGHDLPGVRASTALMVECHKKAMAEQPWLKMIGWDVIIAKGGPVFFEGNYAQMRLPRRVFLSWGTLWYCLANWS